MRESFEANLRALSAAGVKVTELAMPAAFDTMGEAQDVIMAYDLAREYAAIKRDHAALCDPGLIEYLTMGEGLSAAEYAGALDAADACRRAFYDVAREVDAVAPPASSTGSSAFIRIWSLLHNPSITLPVARGPNGLPLGFQMVGFVKEDARLLYWARCAERILGSTAHQP
jgi:Asp-tRNA(Asn)/Glu-tRNA(Gln) amidotransferase A subunit family amidase